MTKYLIATLSAFSVACGGTADAPAISIQAVSSDPSGALTMSDDAQAIHTLQSATVNVSYIELELNGDSPCSDHEDDLEGAECDDDSKIRLSGPFTVDLLEGTMTPDLSALQLPSVHYNKIKIRFDEAANGVTFAATTSFEHNGQSYDLEFALDFDADVEFERSGGIVLADGSSLVAEFVVDNWLQGLDIGRCIDNGDAQSSNGVIVLSEETAAGDCSDVESIVKENLKNSGKLDDDNEDESDS